MHADFQVTASVDRLDLTSPITLGLEDMLISGQAGWAGRSSLQIDVKVTPDLCMLSPDKSTSDVSAPRPFLHGSVVFVAVNDHNKGVAINPLVPNTETEKKDFENGEAMNLERKASRKVRAPAACSVKTCLSLVPEKCPLCRLT